MNVRKIISIVAFFSVMLLNSPAEDLTYSDLVYRLVDLEHLSLLPQPGERNAMWSSWNRASAYDKETGKYVNWGQNGDGRAAIREENGLQVLAEMDGPGVIWRIWSAAPGLGRVMIYLDGQDKPVIDMPFADYFRGAREPFNYPSLCYIVTPVKRKQGAGGGCNFFVPIPYRKSCKIVAEPNWGAYYQITYSSLPGDTSVNSFSTSLPDADKRALNEVDRYLSGRLGENPYRVITGMNAPRKGGQTSQKQIAVGAGETVTVCDLKGSRAVMAIHVRPSFTEADAAEALRALTIQMRWDGEEQPSVWSPLGDFFGTCPGINKYKSLPLGMTDEGFYSYWYMPFANRGLIQISNDGDKPYELDFEITHAPLDRPHERYARFHAKWHRDADLPPEPERWMDWTLLKTKGQGRFVGTMLHVWNPLGGWWGEGDEKFYVDNEKYPSTFGTGSEDYFGYAWCRPELFQMPFHGQTHNPGSNKGNVSVSRWQLADHVPFQTSFFGTIEKYFPQSKAGEEWVKARQESCRYAAVACWYLAPGGHDPYLPASLEERTGYYEVPPPPFSVPGALEGESLAIKSVSAGEARPQPMERYGDGWSRAQHLWWHVGTKPGDTLVLVVPVEKAGSYELLAQFTKARDYGIVKLSLDGKPLGKPLDLYNPDVIPTGEISLGRHELSAGLHELVVEVVGTNEKALQKFMFGLDYLRLKRF